MSSRQISRMLLATVVTPASLILCATTFAQVQDSRFQPGERVEAEQMGEWRAGTVVESEHGTNRIRVRLDDDGKLPDQIPAEVREKFLTESFRSDEVRPLRGEARAVKPATAALHTWTDRSGKHRVEARYDGMNGERIVLVRADGKRIEIPLDRLSEADMHYIRTLQETADNPFQEVSATGDGPAPRAANWQDARRVHLQTFTQWTYTPPQHATATAPPSTAGSDVSVVLKEIPDSDRFFEKTLGVYASSDGRRVVVCRQQGDVRQDTLQYVETVDCANGKSLGLIALPSPTAVLDVLADENLILYRPADTGFGMNGRLTIARIETDRLAPIAAWEPYADEEFDPSRDVDQARFLGGDRVMTINVHGKALTVWDVGQAKALLNVPVASAIGLKMSLSTDRQLLAVIMERGVAILDLVAGKHVATLPAHGQIFQQVAFRDDAQQLAGVSDRGVVLWDLATGEELVEFYHPAADNLPNLEWADHYLLVDNRYLFDPERRILLWDYRSAPSAETAADLAGGSIWLVPKADEGRETMLIAAPIPHPAAIRAAASLPSAEEMLVVKPGDEVSIEVDIDPSVPISDEIRQSLHRELGATGDQSGKIVVLDSNVAAADVVRRKLEAALEAAGLKVVDGAKLKLKAICKPQPTQTIRINTDNRWPVREKDIVERTITPHASYLELSLAGEPLWKRGYVATPGLVIYLKAGESLDQALERLTNPDLGVFTGAKFSGYVARPGKATNNGAYGVSQFSTHGWKDGPAAAGEAFE